MSPYDQHSPPSHLHERRQMPAMTLTLPPAPDIHAGAGNDARVPKSRFNGTLARGPMTAPVLSGSHVLGESPSIAASAVAPLSADYLSWVHEQPHFFNIPVGTPQEPAGTSQSATLLASPPFDVKKEEESAQIGITTPVLSCTANTTAASAPTTPVEPQSLEGDAGIQFIHSTLESVKHDLLLSKSVPKKKRLRTTSAQLMRLQEAFDRDPMPTPAVRAELADELGMTSRSVQVWFQNRRAKCKRGSTAGLLETVEFSPTDKNKKASDGKPTNEATNCMLTFVPVQVRAPGTAKSEAHAVTAVREPTTPSADSMGVPASATDELPRAPPHFRRKSNGLAASPPSRHNSLPNIHMYTAVNYPSPNGSPNLLRHHSIDCGDFVSQPPSAAGGGYNPHHGGPLHLPTQPSFPTPLRQTHQAQSHQPIHMYRSASAAAAIAPLPPSPHGASYSASLHHPYFAGGVPRRRHSVFEPVQRMRGQVHSVITPTQQPPPPPLPISIRQPDLLMSTPVNDGSNVAAMDEMQLLEQMMNAPIPANSDADGTSIPKFGVEMSNNINNVSLNLGLDQGLAQADGIDTSNLGPWNVLVMPNHVTDDLYPSLTDHHNVPHPEQVSPLGNMIAGNEAGLVLPEFKDMRLDSMGDVRLDAMDEMRRLGTIRENEVCSNFEMSQMDLDHMFPYFVPGGCGFSQTSGDPEAPGMMTRRTMSNPDIYHLTLSPSEEHHHMGR